MSALHDAARIVVAAWVSDRRTWVEECNQAVMALDAALKAEQVCKCNLRTRLVGDGCEVCNPELAAELAQQAEPAQEPVAAAFATAFGAEQHPTDDRVVIEWRDGVPYLNGQEIDPGTLEIRRDGATYRAAERVAVQPEPAQEPVADPFNCPKCGRHDFGLHGACPACDAQQAEPVEPVASRLKMHSHDVPTTMRTELHSWEKSVLGPPHPGDFGIPKEHWEAAQHYANYWNDNRAKAQPPEPAQEPVAWMYTGIKQDGTEHGPHLVWKPAYMDAMSASMGAQATPLYTAPPQRKPLTDEEILYIYNQLPNWGMGMDSLPQGLEKFARAIEAAHGIGEKK